MANDTGPLLNVIFRQDFINFLFSLKKKIFFKRRKIFLKQLRFNNLQILSKLLLKRKKINKRLLKIIKKI